MRFLADRLRLSPGVDERLSDQALVLQAPIELLLELGDPPLALATLLDELANAAAHRVEKLDDRRTLVAEESPWQLVRLDAGRKRRHRGLFLVCLRT